MIVFVAVTLGNSFEFVQKLGASGVAVIEACSFNDMVLLESGLQHFQHGLNQS